MRTLRIASLFAGCGGTDIGIVGGFTYLGEKYKTHPARLVYANDFDPGACDLFDANFSIKISRADIRKVEAHMIPEHDILTAGFPCQSFSIVAQNPPRLGIKDSEKGALFEEVCRILKYRQPKGFICENVKGILSVDNSEAFPIIMESLRNCGYHVIHLLLNSYHYGVPQRRERVFIIGFKDKSALESFRPPMPVDRFSVLKDVVSQECDIPDKYFFSQRAIDGMRMAKKEMNKGRVQNLDAPCGTVGAHLAKISLNSTDPVLCINGRFRRFIPREVARIQSFPDSYSLFAPESKQYKALGNAIPPVLAWHVMKAFVEALARAESKDPLNFWNNSFDEKYRSEMSEADNANGNYTPDRYHRPVQLTLFETKSLFVVNKSPVTLLGTYRKTCRDWIINNNLYNYPVSEEDLEQNYELLAVRRLILKRQSDEPLYFLIKGYSVITRTDLKKLGYIPGKNHSVDTKYILYSLEKLDGDIPVFSNNEAYIAGKGTKG